MEQGFKLVQQGSRDVNLLIIKLQREQMLYEVREHNEMRERQRY